jgi:hypothetical protein
MTETRGTTRTDTRRADRAGEGSRAGRPFDIRRVIGGLFVLYGLLVGGAGLLDGDAARSKAAGIDINLWAGLGMLLFGVGFLVWMRLNPVQAPPASDQADQQAEQVVDLRDRADQGTRRVH